MSESAKHHPGKGDKSHAGDSSYVGIDAILEQMRRKAMKQGFELNLMVVGKKHEHKSFVPNTAEKRIHLYKLYLSNIIKWKFQHEP